MDAYPSFLLKLLLNQDQVAQSSRSLNSHLEPVLPLFDLRLS